MSIQLWVIFSAMHSALALFEPVTDTLALSPVDPPADALWKKPSAIERAATKSDVLVSVRYNKDPQTAQKTFVVHGLSVIQGPRERIFKKATDWEQVGKFSSLFTNSAYYKEPSQVAVDLSVLGFSSSVLVQVKVSDYQIFWHVLRGPFTGLSGVMEFITKNPSTTQVNSWGSYHPQTDPWSGSMTAFVLEGILERIGTSLKRYAER